MWTQEELSDKLRENTDLTITKESPLVVLGLNSDRVKAESGIKGLTRQGKGKKWQNY